MKPAADPLPQSQSEILRWKIAFTDRRFREALTSFWSHPDLSRLFPRFLVLLHQIMRASVPLMRRARDVARAASYLDPANARLADYFDVHIEEEANHDVWVLDDLEASGFSRAAVLSQVPSAGVAALVGSQYYWIEHHHPVALLGYIAVLEGYPPQNARIDQVVQRTGLPETLFRTYRKHGELDPDHSSELNALIDGLPLTPPLLGLIGMSAMHTIQQFAEAIEDLFDATGEYGLQPVSVSASNARELG